MRILDLFCGGGGASMGYHRAGFDVVGVDIKPQPRYPFDIWPPCDAIEFLRARVELGEPWEFDAIHASPPCPRYSSISHVHGVAEKHPDLVASTRELLKATGLPYVIENVVGAPLEDPTLLCGAAFGLGTLCDDGKERHLRRHRLFETNFFLVSAGCACDGSEPIGVYGNGGGQQKTVRNGGRNRGYMGRIAECSRAMGIDWMTKRELSDALPPAYTEFIGQQLLEHVSTRSEAISQLEKGEAL